MEEEVERQFIQATSKVARALGIKERALFDRLGIRLRDLKARGKA